MAPVILISLKYGSFVDFELPEEQVPQWGKNSFDPSPQATGYFLPEISWRSKFYTYFHKKDTIIIPK